MSEDELSTVAVLYPPPTIVTSVADTEDDSPPPLKETIEL